MEVRPIHPIAIHPIECECAHCGSIVEHAAAPAPSRGILFEDRLYLGLALLAAAYFFAHIIVAVLK